jgi:cytochrome c biogenesis protein CcdA
MTQFAELGVALLAGLLSTLSPCIFPLLPIVLGASMQRHRLAPLAMGAGMVLSFALLGLLLGLTGDALDLDPEWARDAGGVLLLVLGATMLVPALGERLSRWLTPLATGANTASAHLDAASVAGAFLTGGLLGMVWTPCSGPLLASAMAMVATEGGALRGTVILGMFGLGAAAVMVAVAYASRAGFSRVREWLMAHSERVRRVFAAFVMLLGAVFLWDADRWLEARLLTMMPDAWIRLTTRF